VDTIRFVLLHPEEHHRLRPEIRMQGLITIVCKEEVSKYGPPGPRPVLSMSVRTLPTETIIRVLQEVIRTITDQAISRLSDHPETVAAIKVLREVQEAMSVQVVLQDHRVEVSLLHQAHRPDPVVQEAVLQNLLPEVVQEEARVNPKLLKI
jgi:hypothetical protein